MKIFVISVGFLFLMSGCSSNQPQPKAEKTFNPTRKGIVIVQDKAYRVPYGASYNDRPMGKDSAVILKYVYQHHGVPCKIGDLGWREKTLGAEFHRYSSAKDWDNADRVFTAMARSGKVGCSRPLTDKEYEYYLYKDKQAADYLKETAPKNYNVNVTHDGNINYRGTVYQY